MPRLAIALLACAVVSVLAHAPARGEPVDNFYDGNDINRLCLQNRGTFDRGLAWGYTVGTFDRLLGDREICAPPGVKVGQIGDMACKYLADHPEKRHLTASSVLHTYFKREFPCP